MDETSIRELDSILASGDACSGLDFLIAKYREAGNYGLLFEARLMKKRFELGLPPVQTEASSEFPAELRSDYDQAMVEAAREAGTLALQRGNIAGAWPYFRAIGDTAPVVEAIDKLSEASDAVLEIAFQEGVHPSKGLEFILNQHGICRAITCFGMYAVQNGRAECIALLVRHLHSEVLERIGRAVEGETGSRPETRSIPELIQGRDWLFGEYDTYIDTSHVLSVLPYSLETTDPEMLSLFSELCVYGTHLSAMFQSRGQPPFENPFVDYGHYVRALLDADPEEHIQHFRNKIAESDPEEVDTAPAELLVNLLVKLQRYPEAVQISLQHLGSPSYDLTCPTTLRLCYFAKDYERMRELARDRQDLLSYLAATVLART